MIIDATPAPELQAAFEAFCSAYEDKGHDVSSSYLALLEDVAGETFSDVRVFVNEETWADLPLNEAAATLLSAARALNLFGKAPREYVPSDSLVTYSDEALDTLCRISSDAQEMVSESMHSLSADPNHDGSHSVLDRLNVRFSIIDKEISVLYSVRQGAGHHVLHIERIFAAWDHVLTPED
ncbi:hypothetical protein ACIP5N_27595 [Streptomyces sp. NPDC088768]|uniref:hypothetical protein n=1 Tax=Streptomyces sp. NPDC088768 TaxID=3365894 RepID=UPI00381CA75D